MADPTTADRVRTGLVLLAGDPRWWPPAHAAAFRNRLLDEGGGDARPHVELVWRLHELRVAERLALAEGAPLARCRTVSRDVAAEAFLDRDATWWGVVTWALALGVVDDATLAAEAEAQARAPHASAASARAAPRGAAAQPPVATRMPAAQASPGPTRAAASPKRRWTIGTPGTPRSPLPRGPSPRGVIGLLALIGGGFATIVGGARLLRPAQAETAKATAAAPASAVPAASASATASTTAPSPAVLPVDSASRQGHARDTPPVVSGAAPVAGIPPGIRGEVRLRDGRRLGGIIDLVTASDVFLHDTTSGLPMAMPLVFVAEVRAADGRVAWAPPVGSEPAPASPTAVALRARGVGGTYRVTVRNATVDGDPACREGWSSAALVLTEQIAHVPGAAVATLASRPGVSMRIADDGQFAAGPADGVDGATRWRFAMQGRFAPEGFLATSDLRTETTLKWRKVQRCWIRADLAGVRRR